MTTENLDQKRASWLGVCKELTLKMIEREGVYTNLCPSSYKFDEKERKENLKRAADLTRELTTFASRMAILERDGAIGTKRLLGIEPPEIVRMVLALLVTARLSAVGSREVKRVNEILDFVGGRDPERSLQVRNLFRDDSILRPHIHLGLYPTPVIDEGRVYLTEISMNKALGLASDNSEVVCNAVALATNGKWDGWGR
jgi:hypothetical protein